jgi:hypothetical protein
VFRSLGRLEGSSVILSTPPGPDGLFEYTSVPPGHYTIYARADAVSPAARGTGQPLARGSGAGASRGSLFAMTEVDVTDADVSGLVLNLQPGVRLQGRIVFDASRPAPDVMGGIRINLQQPGGGWSSSTRATQFGPALVSPSAAVVSGDGRFVVNDVAPGSYNLAVTPTWPASDGWWLRSALLGGRDALDEPLTVRASAPGELVLTFTDATNEVSGALRTSAGAAASEYFVVVIPSDRGLWQPGSRRFRAVRPDTSGQFILSRLPSGDYRLAALIDFEPADFEDTIFLEELVRQSVPVTVRDSERTVQDLQVVR